MSFSSHRCLLIYSFAPFFCLPLRPLACSFVRYGIVVGRAYTQPRAQIARSCLKPSKQRAHHLHLAIEEQRIGGMHHNSFRAADVHVRTPDGFREFGQDTHVASAVGRGAGPSSASYVSAPEATPAERLLMFLRQKCSVVESRAQDESPAKRMTQCVFF